MVMLRRWPVLREGEWSCYGGAVTLMGGKMVMLQRWSLLKEGEWSCYRGGYLNRGKMVMLQRLSLQRRENCQVTEVASLMEEEWSC